MPHLARILALASLFGGGSAWAVCNPPQSPAGSIGCQPVLTSPQTTDVLLLWRPSLFPASSNQITLANFLGNLPPGMPLSALGAGYVDGQLLIGKTSTGNLVASTLAAGSGVTITNGSGLVTIAATGAASSLTPGSTTISGGTPGRILFDNTTLGESAGLTFNGASTLSLGVAGSSVGTLALKNATSGTLNLIPATGALGTVTATLPANSGTVAELNLAQTWSAAQSFGSGNLKLNGATSGATTLNAAAVAGTNTITLPAGTTDFSVTGGTEQFVSQASSGAGFTVVRPTCSTLSNAGTGCAATAPLSGTSGSIGGGALLAGACASTTVSVASSTTAMAVVATPVTYPGDGSTWLGYVSSSGTVTVKVCAIVALTPNASVYNVRVLP